MSFVDDLLRSVPGGTSIGNTIRKVANEVTGGVLGNGAMIISQVDYDLKNLSDAEYLAKYGKTKTGIVDPSVKPNSNIMTVEQQLKTGVNSQSSVKITFVGLVKKYWPILLFPGTMLVIYIGRKLFKKKSYNNTKTYKRGR